MFLFLPAGFSIIGVTRVSLFALLHFIDVTIILIIIILFIERWKGCG